MTKNWFYDKFMESKGKPSWADNNWIPAPPLTEDQFMLNAFNVGRGMIGHPRAFFLHLLHASTRFKYRRKRERVKLFARVDALVAQVPPLTPDEEIGRMFIQPDVMIVPMGFSEVALRHMKPGEGFHGNSTDWFLGADDPAGAE